MNSFSFGRALGPGRPAATPLGAVLDLDLRAGRYVRLGREESFASQFAFTRASVADWLNAAGAGFEPQAAANQLRRGSAGALIESAATNLFLNAFAPATQTLALAAGAYTAQIHGPSGSLSLSGAASGTVTPGNPLLFSLAGSGSVAIAVREIPLAVSVTPTPAATAANAFPTSPIQTVGAAATRAAEALTVPVAGLGLAGAWTVVLVATAAPFAAGSDSQVAMRLEPNAALGWRITRISSNQMVVGQIGVGGLTVTTVVPNATRFALAVASDGQETLASLNGGAVVTATASGGLLVPEVLRLGGNAGGGNAWNGLVERAVLFPRKLADTDIRSLSSLAAWGG